MKSDYLAKNFESLDSETAVQLCCLEIRRFFREMPQVSLDKKSNFDYLERDVGLDRFLPATFLAKLNGKSGKKTLRKSIQQNFKKYTGTLSAERDVMIKFCDVVKTKLYKFDQERFRCALGVSCYNLSQNTDTAVVYT